MHKTNAIAICMEDDDQILDSEDKERKPKLSRGKKLFPGFLAMFFGWLAPGIAYTESLPGELNSILFYGGLVLFFVGFILLIMAG